MKARNKFSYPTPGLCKIAPCFLFIFHHKRQRRLPHMDQRQDTDKPRYHPQIHKYKSLKEPVFWLFKT
ncbi:MAG: hypothetical protein FWD87_02315 [Spirochaetaceae bacterium]|nr:hypothetical protein [Spirochaetaceae bacterium]